ncbi:hypothetical protein H2200_004908 [Cladophialophora chaetospira]|uniref:Uncharacterized protein n=1 Tax=Cladophialophora chaetospira TaxID=386627 RepID=A0AA38XE73_9EURO|nr:hypothetical protein H2200_004908 [Cladophialophora chaetospira]
MYQRGREKDFAGFGLAERSREVLSEDLPLPLDDALIAEEVVHFRFFRSTLLWLDIVRSITTGSTPQLSSDHFCVVAAGSQTKLEEVMGCENRVLLQIGRIAVLSHNTSALRHDTPGRQRFDQRADEVGKDTRLGLSEGAMEDVLSSERNPIAVINASDTTGLVTYFFARMGIIYLHLLRYGYQELELLETTIAAAMELLRMSSTSLLPALVCPLFFIGSVAAPGDVPFFRDAFSSPPLLEPALKHRARILPVLEEIWNRRGNSTKLSWNNVLELTYDILLI